MIGSSNKIYTEKIWPEIQYFSREIDEQLEINSHYKGYLKKQKAKHIGAKKVECKCAGGQCFVNPYPSSQYKK